MPRTRNPIIEADNEDEDFDVNEFADEDERDFGAEDVGEGEFTDEDVQESVRAMDSRQRATLDSTRRAGKAAPSGPQRARTTKTQQVEKARTPARARVVDWKPSDTLDAPPPLPGMEGRWVRFRIGNEDDQKNFSAKQRSGWVPRPASSVPKGYYPPTYRHAQLGEVIAVGDLIYCERPREIGLAQKRYFRDKLKRQTQAGQRHVRKAQRPDHPIDVDERREKPSVGYGRKRRVSVQSDDEG